MRKLADEMKNDFILQRSGNVYPKSLNDAHCSILKQNLNDIPLLLLEDDVKFKSSLTLFDAVLPDSVFRQALVKYYNGEEDPLTIELLL
jgi:hypothetical protein